MYGMIVMKYFRTLLNCTFIIQLVMQLSFSNNYDYHTIHIRLEMNIVNIYYNYREKWTTTTLQHS